MLCTEEVSELIADAEGYLSRAGLWDRVTLHQGAALEVPTNTEGMIDVVFVDTNTFQYPEALQCSRSRIRVGGAYLCGNVLWRGMVPAGAYDTLFPGWHDAIRKHNRLVGSDPDRI